MRYADTREKSAEYLRQALALMTKHKAGFHPVSFAVWYEYLAGTNRALNEALDQATAELGTLDDEAIYSLFRTHIGTIDDAHNINAITSSMQTLLTSIAASATTADDEASRFGNSLDALRDGVYSLESPLGLLQIKHDTDHMRGAVSTLQQQLAESKKEVARLQTEVVRAREDALIDGLTGLNNRRSFDLAVNEAVLNQESSPHGISLLLCDIDHFKRINDTYGHLFGDKIIQTVAKVLKDNIKGADLAARYGGEEFAVLLPNTSIEGARVVAENIRAIIARGKVKKLNSQEAIENVTISIGISEFDGSESIETFIERADKALYAAKTSGRNRVSALQLVSQERVAA